MLVGLGISLVHCHLPMGYLCANGRVMRFFFCRARWKLDTHSMGMDGILGWIKLKSDWLTDQRLVSDIISKHKWMLPNSICQIRDLEQ